MAIKIECSNCGFQNDLGRIFCSQCGQKLDLRDTSMESLKERREFDFGKLFQWLLSLVVLIGIATILSLAFWPATTVPVYMDAAGSKQVPVKIAAILRALSYNRAITLDFDEGELNGFLAERAKLNKLKAFTIDLKPGSFDLCAALTWTPVTNVAFLAKIQIPVTISLKGGFQGGVFLPENGRIGHLPLPGRSMKFSTDLLGSYLPDILNEKRIIDSLRTVAIDERRVDLTLAPVGK